MLGKTDIKFDDLLTIDLTLMDSVAVNDAIIIVYSKYTDKGASGSVAKSSSFIKDIIDTL
jgi:hypothetical protein